jgi:nitrogen fixation protein FixH
MGAVVAVNLILTYFAFSSSTGLVSKHPFTEGNGYNGILQAGAHQDALGWVGNLAFTATGSRRGAVTVRFTDRAGKPLTGLAVTAHIERPVEPLPATSLPLPETSAGHYEALAEMTRPGQWNVRIAARRGGDLYEFAERIFVK